MHNRVRSFWNHRRYGRRDRPSRNSWLLGPGYIVPCYMEPGNGTLRRGGRKRLRAALSPPSKRMAICCRRCAARLGIVRGAILPRACRDAFPRALAGPLWGMAEIAICATIMAEVIGHRIGINTVFGYPLKSAPAHRARRIPDPLEAEAWIPMDRVSVWRCSESSRVLCRATRSQSPDWRGVSLACSDGRDRRNPECYISSSASSEQRDDRTIFSSPFRRVLTRAFLETVSETGARRSNWPRSTSTIG